MDGSPEKESLPVDGFVVKAGVSGRKFVRAYDVGVSKRVADLLGSKPFNYSNDRADEDDLWPLHGVVNGDESDCHVVANSRIGPKAFVPGLTVKTTDAVSKGRLKVLNKIANFVVGLVEQDSPGLIACDRNALSEVKKEVFGECFYSLCIVRQEKFDEFGFAFECMHPMDCLSQQQREGVLRRRRFMTSLARACDAKLHHSFEGLSGFMKKYNLVFRYQFEVSDGPCLHIFIADADEVENGGVEFASCGDVFFEEMSP